MPKRLPHRNHLLAAIPQKSRRLLLEHSSEVQLDAASVLHDAKTRPSHAFFLTSGLASILAMTTVGLAAEVGVVGREGFVGSLHLIGPADPPTHCRMQIAGAALRVPFKQLQQAFDEDERFHRRILEYVQFQAHRLSQVAGCHRTHEASQRLSRWLLTAQDLTESSTLDITQEALSELLGTERVTIAAAAGKLQKEQMIEYRRGHIRIVNRKKLELVACDCYSTIREFHRGLYQG